MKTCFLMLLFIFNIDKAIGQSAKARWIYSYYYRDYTYNSQGGCVSRISRTGPPSLWEWDEENALKKNSKSRTKINMQQQLNVVVTPLPNIKEQITIEVSGLIGNNSLSYMIASISGMTIFSGSIGNGKSVLSMSKLPKGIYILRISGDSFEEEYKLIRE